MAQLVLSPNLERTDDFYAALLEAHDGLEAEATHALNARLFLILANHIGDHTVLEQALNAARRATSRSICERT